MILICFCVLWLCGTYVGFALAETNIHLQLYITLPVISALIIASILMRRKKPVLLILLCFAALLGGASRFQSYEASLSGDNLQSHSDTYATIQGVITSDPEVRDTYTLLRISLNKIKADSQWQNITGKVLVYADKYPDMENDRDFPYYRYGDSIEMSGQLEEPPVFEDFNYREYLERQQIYSIVYYPNVELIESGQGNKYGHPDAEVLGRLNDIDVLRTDASGTIELFTDGQTLWTK